MSVEASSDRFGLDGDSVATRKGRAILAKDISRRNFNKWTLLGVLLSPWLSGRASESSERKADLAMQQLGMDFSDRRRTEIHKAVQSTERQAAVIRAYPLPRDTQPALILGVYDAQELFSCEEGESRAK